MAMASRTELRGALLFCAALALPIGTPVADEPGRAVLRGRVTNEAGEPLAEVRVRVAIPATDMRDVGPTTGNDLREARTDARGEYRLELVGVAKPTKVSIDALKPGYHRLVRTIMVRVVPVIVEVTPGKVVEASIKLKPAAYYRGVVVDEQGKPIAGVKVIAGLVLGRASSGVEGTASLADGSFELFNCPVKPFDLPGGGKSRTVVSFTHSEYIGLRLDDLDAIEPKDRDTMRVVLATGLKLTGTVVNASGKPVANAAVRAVRKDGSHRQAGLTDANGRFALRGLSGGLTLITVRGPDVKQWMHLPLALNGDKDDLKLRLQPIALPANLVRHTALGMQLADVTPELKTAYDLPWDHGALILDPGKDSRRLEIGALVEGNVFWKVGKKEVGSVRELVDQILTETSGQKGPDYWVPVVYWFIGLRSDGNNTQFMRLTKDDIKSLQVLSGQLRPEVP